MPGAEYDRDPMRIEHQARLIAMAPKLMRVANDLVALVAENLDDAPPELMAIARNAAAVLDTMRDRRKSADDEGEDAGGAARAARTENAA